jgi:hypothetical protein
MCPMSIPCDSWLLMTKKNDYKSAKDNLMARAIQSDSTLTRKTLFSLAKLASIAHPDNTQNLEITQEETLLDFQVHKIVIKKLKNFCRETQT